TSSNVVTITLPAGCTLANSAAGTVAVAGVTNPAAGAYPSTSFKVHTSADVANASPTPNVTISAATAPTAVSFAGSRMKAGAVATWTAQFATTASGALGA